MFRLLYGNRRDGTCRNMKNHVTGSKREKYSSYTLKTLGSGDALAAVKLPEGEDLNEWFAANTVDFFNEVRIIWDILEEIGVGDEVVGQGFPAGFEYRWADTKNKTTIQCSGPQYIRLVIDWIDNEVNNETNFPTTSSVPFPNNFLNILKVIYTRMFRLFAIIYSHHFLKLESVGAVSHLNTSFKHFLFFIWEYELVKDNELDALQDLIEEIKSRYISAYGRPQQGPQRGIAHSRSNSIDSKPPAALSNSNSSMNEQRNGAGGLTSGGRK